MKMKMYSEALAVELRYLASDGAEDFV